MPHATVNGEQQASSKFLSHVTSYPVVSDGINNFKSHPYGKKSLELADNAYQRFAKPVEPYLETPYSYAKPYVTKADELADSGLEGIEQRFPIVKEDTQTVYDTAKTHAMWPYNYATSTYNDEYSKTAQHHDRGPGYVTFLLAVISTLLKMASDFFQAVADFLGPKYDESKHKAGEYAQQARERAQRYAQAGQDKLHEYQKLGHDKVAEAQKAGQDKLDQSKAQGQQLRERAQQQTQQK